MRIALAAAILVTALCGGFFVGALGASHGRAVTACYTSALPSTLPSLSTADTVEFWVALS